MKSTGVIFKPWEVRAFLDGRKTMFRRVVKPQPPSWAKCPQDATMGGVTRFWWTDRDIDCDDLNWWPGYDHQESLRCEFGSPGDEIWVKETWAMNPCENQCDACVLYRATDPGWDDSKSGLRWRSSTTMPRWASRIRRTIKSVRVERLQEITEEDAVKECVHKPVGSQFWYADPMENVLPSITAVGGFWNMWKSIHDPGSLDSNLWVWVGELEDGK